MPGKFAAAVAVLREAVRDLEPDRIDAGDAACLLDTAAEGERLCGAAKALLIKRIDDARIWVKDGPPLGGAFPGCDERDQRRPGRAGGGDGASTPRAAQDRSAAPSGAALRGAGQRGQRSGDRGAARGARLVGTCAGGRVRGPQAVRGTRQGQCRERGRGARAVPADPRDALCALLDRRRGRRPGRVEADP